jgi:hypothetical protein
MEVELDRFDEEALNWLREEGSQHESVHAAVAVMLDVPLLGVERRRDPYYLPGRRCGLTTVDNDVLDERPAIERLMILMGPSQYPDVLAQKLSGGDVELVSRARPAMRDEARKRLLEMFDTPEFQRIHAAFYRSLWKKGKLDENDISHVLEKEVE